MKYSIGGNVTVRNAIELDYPFRECIESLLPVCDEVIVTDSDSTDGTRQELNRWAKKQKKLRILNYPWGNPVGKIDWILDKENFGRERLNSHYHLMLEADEILHEDSYKEVLEAVTVDGSVKQCIRVNFWHDPQHMVPFGHLLSTKVIRLAPKSMWMPGDAPHPKGEYMMGLSVPCGIKIMHYGYLREDEAFYRKMLSLGLLIHGVEDPVVVACKGAGIKPKDINWFGTTKPELFTGTHPKVIRQWLIDRGYSL